VLKANFAKIRALVRTMCPVLLEQPGIGPVTAAIALTAWSHHGRVRSEAAFAALAGVNPIPASSGRTSRHRLNRGGDRTLGFGRGNGSQIGAAPGPRVGRFVMINVREFGSHLAGGGE
jgi:hypothetical protein